MGHTRLLTDDAVADFSATGTTLGVQPGWLAGRALTITENSAGSRGAVDCAQSVSARLGEGG